MKLYVMALTFLILSRVSLGIQAHELSWASECETTGVGAGNDVACGGMAARCESAGVGEGNYVACGGFEDLE